MESISIFLFKMDVLVGSIYLLDTDDEGLEVKETTEGVLFLVLLLLELLLLLYLLLLQLLLLACCLVFLGFFLSCRWQLLLDIMI